jgi:hypothetical protein
MQKHKFRNMKSETKFEWPGKMECLKTPESIDLQFGICFKLRVSNFEI